MRKLIWVAGTVLLVGTLGTAGQRQGQNPPPYRVFGIPGQAPLQPKKSAVGFGRPLQLKGSGKGKALQVGPAGWAERLIADLEQLKSDVAGPRVPPAARRALTERADAALEKAAALEQSLGQNNRNAWYRAYGETEAALADLGKVVFQNIALVPDATSHFDQASYASQQIGVALATGDDDVDRVKRAIARLAASHVEQAERLRVLTDEAGPAVRDLEKRAGQYVRATRQFSKAAAGDTGKDRLRREFGTVAAEWQDVLGALGQTSTSGTIRYQATRVDGLNRRLGELLGFVPPEPSQPPAPPQRQSILAVGAGAGMGPRVVVFADDKGTVAHSFYAYNRDIYKSGVRVAVADLNGDGMPEVVTTPGGRGLGRIKVFDGRDMSHLVWLDAFDQQVTDYGYFVAAVDLTRDGRALVAIAPDAGGPPIAEVYDLALGKQIATVTPFPKRFIGGVRLAWGDLNGDGTPDLITATGPGEIGSQVRAYDGTNFEKVIAEFFVIDDKYRGGVWIAAADLTKNNRAEIVVGLDAGARPLVRIYDGQQAKLLHEFEPYPAAFRGGVRVAIGDPSDGERMKVICSPGPGGEPGMSVLVMRRNGKVLSQIDPFPGVNRGMFVGSR